MRHSARVSPDSIIHPVLDHHDYVSKVLRPDCRVTLHLSVARLGSNDSIEHHLHNFSGSDL